MQTLFVGIEKLYTMRGHDLSAITDAAILVDGNTIQWVGKRAQAVKFRRAKKVSLDAKTVLPAFIDCHTHTVYAGERRDEFERRNSGVSYQQIAKEGGGIAKTVASTRKASLKNLVELAEARSRFFLRQGVTTVEMKSGYGLTLKDEIKILQAIRSIKTVRAIPTFLGLHAIPPEFRDSDSYVKEVIGWLPKIKKLAGRADIFIEKNYFTPQHAHSYFTALQSHEFDIAAHCEQLSQSGGIDKALEFGAISVDHLVHADQKQVQKLAKSKTVAVLLPASDFYLKINYPNARALIDSGVDVALATDFNPGSSPTQSVNFVGVLARLNMQMSLAEVLRAFTVSAATALGLQDVLGSLREGKLADFVAFDCDIDDLFYQVGHHPVRAVIKNGKLSYTEKS